MLRVFIDFFEQRKKEQVIYEVVGLLGVILYAATTKHFYNIPDTIIGLNCAILGALLYILMPLIYCVVSRLSPALSTFYRSTRKRDRLVYSKSRRNFPTTFVWEENRVYRTEFIINERIQH